MKRAIHYLVILLLVFQASEVLGADPVSFTANVDKHVMDRSEQVILVLRVSGARPSGQPQLPRLDDFQVLSSGSSTRTEIINGVMSSMVEYKYILIPLKSGKLAIPPATIEVAGKICETKPIEIEVKGNVESREERQQKPLFVELKADKATAYLDEQILLTFRFYQSGVQASNFQYSPPSMRGFRMEPLGNPEGEVGSARTEGKLYSTITLRYALFPYQTGELKVGPAMLRCTIPGPRRQSRSRSIFDFDDIFGDSFLFSSSRTPVNLTTEALTIKVLPLPLEGRQEGERISVGQYTMEISVKPKKVKVGDPITVKAVIEGEGNIDTVSAPVIEADSEFKTYEPSSKAEITDRSTAIRGRKTFEEILVPLNEEIKEVPNIRFTYFDTATGKYRTISKGPIPIEVLPAPDEGPARIVELRPSDRGESIELLKKDIHFIKLSPGRFTPTILSAKPVIILGVLRTFVLLIVLPAACYICLLVITRRRERMRSDFAFARRSRAYRRAISGSKRCSSLVEKGELKEFFSRAEAVLSRYIGDRLNVPQASVSRDRAVEHMKALGMDEEAISRAERFYRDCELAQYASMNYEPSDMRKSLEDLNEIIRSIEKKK